MERAFDPRAPAPAAERESDAVQAAVHAVHAARDVGAWYVRACTTAYAAHCEAALAPLYGGASHEAVPAAVDACYAWLCERYALLAADAGGLGAPDAGAALLLECQTRFTLAMRKEALETLPAYFMHALASTPSGVCADAQGVQVAAQLRVLGLGALVQGVLASTATHVLEAAVRRETHGVRGHSLEHAAFPALRDLLDAQLVPALAALLEGRPGGLPAADEACARDAWDLSVSHAPDGARRAPASVEALSVRLDYRLARALGQVRYVARLTQARTAL